MNHAGDALPAFGAVKISVEDAVFGAILQLEAGAFANLQVGGAKALAEFASGKANEVAALHPDGFGRHRHGRDPLGHWRAGGDEQQSGKGEAAHRPCVAGGGQAGKLAARARPG